MRGVAHVGLCILLVPCAVARAEDPPPDETGKTSAAPYAEARMAFDAAVEGEALDVLEKATADLARSAAASTEETEKRDARDLLKKQLKSREDRLLIAALRAYGTLALEGTSRDLRRFVDDKLAGGRSVEVRCAALEAWGRIGDARTHEALLQLIRVPSHKEEDLALARAAAEALGHYTGLSKRDRFQFLKDFMKTFDMIHSAGAGTFMPSAAAGEWWRVLQDPMVASFNAVAKTQHESYQACWDWWNENHRKVRSGDA